MSTDADKIRTLNDELRKTLRGGKALVTSGIAALGPEAVQRLLTALRIFDDFCIANDPHSEHDFGMFEFEGSSIIFKIEYFDANFEFGSPDPADATVTQRVITLMLADEY